MADFPRSRSERDPFGDYFDELCGYFAHRWRFSRDDALDLTQETSIRAYQSLDRLSSADGLKPWLYAIAGNLARNHYQRARRAPSVDSIEAASAAGWEPADEEASPEARLQAAAHASAALACVREKNPTAAEIIYYHDGEGLTHQEIAGLVDESPANCRQLYSRYIRLFQEAGRELAR